MIRADSHRPWDYIIGVVLILAPFLFVFWNIASATWTAILLGAALIVYSLFTRYMESMDRPISFNTHLVLDIILGVFLAISPWLFGFIAFTWNVWVPHVLVGVLFVILSLVTVRAPVGRTTLAGQLGGQAPPEDEDRYRRRR